MSPQRHLIAGSVLFLAGNVAAVSSTSGRAADWISAQVGHGLASAGATLLGLGLILEGCARMARQTRRRGDRLRNMELLAEARSLSYFAEDALQGAIALCDMGRCVELERQALRAQASVLIPFAFLLASAAAAFAWLRGHASQPFVTTMVVLLAAIFTAGGLLAAARSIWTTASTLEPTEAQVHAAVIRHHERLEMEKLAHRSGLSAVAGALVTAAPEGCRRSAA